MSMNDRIWFEGNPWPEGHGLEEFAWTARVVDGVVWFDLHLVTVDYDAERMIEDDPVPYSNWKAAVAWNNFHACTISSTEWHDGGFPVCALGDYSVESLDGYVARVDALPLGEDWDRDDLAFHTYLLGHDAVAGHVIRFVRREGGDRFDIEWEGKIALTYSGEDEFRYRFEARIHDVAAPVLVLE